MLERLEPGKEPYAALEPDEKQSLFDQLIEEVGSDIVPLLTWGDDFRRVVVDIDDELDPNWLDAIDAPPREPPGAWDKLLVIARDPMPKGVAAGLIIYTLAIGRAIRLLKATGVP